MGILGLTASAASLNQLGTQGVTPILVGSLIAFIVAFLSMRSKQILVIDGSKNEIEEHIGKKSIIFKFSEIQYADVERVRDEELITEKEAEPTTQEEVVATHASDAKSIKVETNEQVLIERTHEKAAKLHLNYHPFLALSDGKKYFLFDNKGKGIDVYRISKTLVENINEYIGIPKTTQENLNLYRLNSSGAKGLITPFFILLLFASLSYWALKMLNYI